MKGGLHSRDVGMQLFLGMSSLLFVENLKG